LLALSICGLAAALLPAGRAGARDVDVRGAVRLEGMVNTDRGSSVYDGRVDFEVDFESLVLGGAYRAYDFGGEYNPAGIEPFHDFKHRYVEVRHKGFLFRGGHFFSTFGRGLALRSFEDIDLEYDTALDGFLAEYASDRWHFAALGGNLREAVTPARDRRHRIRAFRTSFSPAAWITLAGNAMDRDAEVLDSEITIPDSLALFDDRTYGGEIELWTGPLVVAGEYVERDGGNYLRSEREGADGHGAYITAGLSTAWLTLLGEYKDYDRFAHLLVSPPICVKEHVWTLMNRVTHEVDFGDERGFLLEGNLAAFETFQVTGGASEARNQAGDLEHWEIFSQMDQPAAPWGIRSLAGSWSREYVGDRFTEYVSGALDAQAALFFGFPLDLTLEMQAVEEPDGLSFENYLAAVAVYPAPNATASLLLESTTLDGLERERWVSAEVRLTLAGGTEVSLSGGTERGGKKCSGGICYDQPEFGGVRLRVTSWF
jgi:hypothetical protein